MTEATTEAKTRAKQSFYLAKVTQSFPNKTAAEKYINDNELPDDVAIIKGREIAPVEQTKKVLN